MMYEQNERHQKIIVKNSWEKGGLWQGDHVSPVLYSIVRKYVCSPILDVGAGTGALMKVLKKYRDVQGIDLSPRTDFIREGKITNMEFKDKTFSTVFCTEVIEHLTNLQIEEGIKEVRRVLKDNANFIITVPYNENLDGNSFVCPNCEHKFHKVGHLQSFNKERMRKTLERYSFKVVFMKEYTLNAMSAVPFGRYLNFLFKRLSNEILSKKTLVVVAEKS